MNIRKLAGDRKTEVGIHRFLSNEDVTQEEIEKSIAQKTQKNSTNVEKVLVIQDTSEIAFPSQKQKKASFGSTGNPYGNGFFIHPNIVVNPENQMVLGMAGIEIWQRTKKESSKTRKQKSIEEKESYKWIKAMQKAQQYLKEIKQKIFVSDRESDIYEYMHSIIASGDQFIVRSTHNRKTDNGFYLEEFIQKTPCVKRYETIINATPKRQQRTAQLHLKYGQLILTRPKHLRGKKEYAEKIDVYFVDVEEDLSTAPNANAKIHWRLFTTLKINTINEAITVVEYYKLRWTIEPIFGGSKKRGLDLETCQLSSFDKIKKLATLAVDAVIQVFFLVKAREGKGTEKLFAEMIFSDEQIIFLHALLKTLEGKTQKQKNIFPVNSLPWASWIIARLGGWKGYNSERPPGYSTFHHGLQKFDNMFSGWKICRI